MLEEFLVISLRTLLFYTIIIIIFRLMGKREIGELSLLDLVVFIMIAELAVVGIENIDSSLFATLIPMFLLMLVQIFLALLSLKSKKFRDIIDGEPVIIINKGKIDENNMRKQRYNLDDLLVQLRAKDIRRISDVEFAILEPSGKLSVFQKENNSEMGDISIPLIMDGEIQEKNLLSLKKTNFWLRQSLKSQGYNNIKLISFCSYEDGEFYVDLKDEN